MFRFERALSVIAFICCIDASCSSPNPFVVFVQPPFRYLLRVSCNEFLDMLNENLLCHIVVPDCRRSLLREVLEPFDFILRRLLGKS